MSWNIRGKQSTVGAQATVPHAAVVQPLPPTDAEVAALVHELRQRIVEFSDGKLRVEEIDARCHLFDYGYVDSLSAVQFLALLEEDYGVRIEDAELLDQLSTLDAIAIRIRTSP